MRMPENGRRTDVDKHRGAITASCNNCRMSVPPAMNTASGVLVIQLGRAWRVGSSGVTERQHGYSSLSGCVADGRDNVDIGAAAADVAAHLFADVPHPCRHALQ